MSNPIRTDASQPADGNITSPLAISISNTDRNWWRSNGARGSLEKILTRSLRLMALAILRRHKPRIIGVTGNVGKTSTRDAIYAVIAKEATVWRGKEGKNYNNEIGVPLTILNAEHHGRDILGWAKIIPRFVALWFSRVYPKFLVIEMGVDHPGDMEYLTTIVEPEIAVITGVGEIPVHVEFFSSPSGVLAEKAKILKVLPASGHAVLNADDAALMKLLIPSGISRHLYGFSDEADVHASDGQIHYQDDGDFRWPAGLSFKIHYQGAMIPVRLHGSISDAQVSAALAAFVVGIVLGFKPLNITAALSSHRPPPGRLRLIRGIKNTLILDDSYNAAPASIEAALGVLKIIEAPRKIAVLGDMLELGAYGEAAHRHIGRLASSIADYIFSVGELSRFIDEEARRNGYDPDTIFHLDEAGEVEKILQPLLAPGDVLLIKGSQSMRMERVVEDVMAEPEKAKDLLARQSVDWKRKA